MKKTGQHIILWIVSLAILNTSIDVADELFAYPLTSAASGIPEYNEIESIAELLMDNTMDQSLPDQKGNEQNGMIKKSCAFDFAIPEKKDKAITNVIPNTSKKGLPAHYTMHLSAGYRIILTPPPNIIA